MVAAKRKTTKRKVAVRKPKPELQYTPIVLLRFLSQEFDFGPKLNAIIDKVATMPAPDPLENPPAAITKALRDESRTLQITPGSAWDTMYLAHHNGHAVSVRFYHNRGGGNREMAGRVKFCWGCRGYMSEASARAHWRDNISTQSLKPRPNATILLDFVRDVAKFRGAQW